ncbi:SLOG family protein [Salinibacter ruber]|uniref:YspA cpYpsA-related SLOG domain-containing protein n=1 Tax=Salinibacter ruber TaxID=146919 RepID=A0A9X2QAI9_9BACT|nr:SLOG family protein [Salinibacter ruber]MCS3661794.1 hypothetical protein [Salinibacter ruber]MCS3711545.1 hypothetical protein [Salinibacter ruber]
MQRSLLPFTGTTEYTIVVAGSRTIEDPEVTYAAIERSGYPISEVVSGTAHGPDTHGENWAIMNDIPVKRMSADWESKGKKAGMLRNKKMAAYADGVVAVWDGESAGTKQMIDHAHDQKMPVFVSILGGGDYQNRYYDLSLNKIPT